MTDLAGLGALVEASDGVAPFNEATLTADAAGDEPRILMRSEVGIGGRLRRRTCRAGRGASRSPARTWPPTGPGSARRGRDPLLGPRRPAGRSGTGRSRSTCAPSGRCWCCADRPTRSMTPPRQPACHCGRPRPMTSMAWWPSTAAPSRPIPSRARWTAPTSSGEPRRTGSAGTACSWPSAMARSWDSTGPRSRTESARSTSSASTRQSRAPGWARRLTARGLQHLVAAGVSAIDLYVEGDNAPALAVYRRLGFTDHARDTLYAR